MSQSTLARIGLGLLLASLIPALAICAASQTEGPAKEDASEPEVTIDPTSVNAACYVCHMTFIHEEISRVHFQEQVTCVTCHGLSAAHANDEDVGATKPDKLYARREIDSMCSKKCHTSHDVSPARVVARFLKRKLPPKPLPVCTDCHGSHRIEHAAEHNTEES